MPVVIVTRSPRFRIHVFIGQLYGVIVQLGKGRVSEVRIYKVHDFRQDNCGQYENNYHDDGKRESGDFMLRIANDLGGGSGTLLVLA